jgi:hypothetical protein
MSNKMAASTGVMLAAITNLTVSYGQQTHHSQGGKIHRRQSL